MKKAAFAAFLGDKPPVPISNHDKHLLIGGYYTSSNVLDNNSFIGSGHYLTL